MSGLSQSAIKYIPGDYYDTKSGATLAQLLDQDDLALSIPVEPGFMREPEASSQAIIVVNLTGRSIEVVMNAAEEFNQVYGNQRYNQREYGAFELYSGESSHFVTPPHCYMVSVSQSAQNSRGKLQIETMQGVSMNELRDKVITFTTAPSTTGKIIANIQNASEGGYTTFQNLSQNQVTCEVSKASTAYKKTPAEVRAEKTSRAPDHGRKPLQTELIMPGAKWHYRVPSPLYIIRALETPKTANLSTNAVLVQGVPSVTDYVELANVQACAGNIVIFTMNPSRDGSISGSVYSAGEVKFVDSNLACTNEE